MPIEAVDFERADFMLLAAGGNAMCLSWYMAVSWEPVTIAVSIAKKRYTHILVLKEMKFTIGEVLMPKEAEQIFGKTSGRVMKKPPINDYTIWMTDFRVTHVHDCGDHTLFVGEMI